MAQDRLYSIQWPEGFRPDDYPVHAFNELFIPAAAEKIWKHLTAAERWPEWYGNCKWIRINGGQARLSDRAHFTWKTFNVKVSSNVLVYRPYQDLGWDARGFGFRGFHGWRLIPQPGGTLVVTEEVQGGLGPRLISPLILRGLLTQHQKWLQGLAQQSRS